MRALDHKPIISLKIVMSSEDFQGLLLGGRGDGETLIEKIKRKMRRHGDKNEWIGRGGDRKSQISN